MTLHAQMRPQDEHLVGAMLACDDARCVVGNAECFAVPMKGGESFRVAKPFLGSRSDDRYLAPAESIALEALYLRYLARRVLRAGGRPTEALRYVVAGLRLDARSFLAERRRGLATALGALIALFLSTKQRLRLFA